MGKGLVISKLQLIIQELEIKIMFKKLPSASSCLLMFLLTGLFCTFFKPSLPGSAFEQAKIIRDLQIAVEKTNIFYGCSFTLFNPDLPEHKDYYENLRNRDAITNHLWDRLHIELAPRKLYYFCQFKERIHVTRQHAFHKKDEADYCILYAKRFYTDTNSWNKGELKWYDERLLQCNDIYKNFLFKINKLDSFINEEFLRYYALDNFSSDKCKAIYDHGLVQFANGNIEKAVSLAEDFLEQVYKENKNLRSFSSEELLNLGITYNEAMEYSKAIDSLNASIEKDPSNKEAYFQRAISYLETGLFDNAVSDFLISEKEKNLLQIIPHAPEEFRDAFLHGLVKGSSEATINFIPSLFSFAYTTVEHPIDSLTNFIDACHILVNITKDYIKEVNWSQVEDVSGLANALVEPGLKKLYESMDQLNPAEQGYLLGHTMGSFGIDFVAGAAVIKGLSYTAMLANACKTVRETGRIYELETLIHSASEADSIIVKAAERAAIRETILEGAKSGRIVIKNPNVQFHIMQDKHAWDKLIQLSGNVEEDTRRVVSLLEEQGILSNQFLKEVEDVAHCVIKKEYEISIGEQRVRAVFNEYTDKGSIFLKDAWVITK